MSRRFGLAPAGSRRLTRSRTNVAATRGSSWRCGLCRFCALAAPLGTPACAGPPASGGGTFLSTLAGTVSRPRPPGFAGTKTGAIFGSSASCPDDLRTPALHVVSISLETSRSKRHEQDPLERVGFSHGHRRREQFADRYPRSHGAPPKGSLPRCSGPSLLRHGPS